jgi:uncharacterized membrane protein (UPF0136 family)
MDKKEILKAKVDYHKTWMTISLVITVSSIIGYYNTNPTNLLARGILSAFAAGFAIILIISFSFYSLRYRELIKKLYK